MQFEEVEVPLVEEKQSTSLMSKIKSPPRVKRLMKTAASPLTSDTKSDDNPTTSARKEREQFPSRLFDLNMIK